MGALLEPWQAGQHTLSEEAAIENALDLELAKRRRAIAAHGLTLHCLAEGGDAGRYYVELKAETAIPEAVRQGWSCWLGSQHEEDAIEIARDAGVIGRFGPIGMSSLTAFLACRISASQKGVTRESRFLLKSLHQDFAVLGGPR